MRQGKTEQSIARCLTSLGSSSHFEWGVAGEPCDTAPATSTVEMLFEGDVACHSLTVDFEWCTHESIGSVPVLYHESTNAFSWTATIATASAMSEKRSALTATCRLYSLLDATGWAAVVEAPGGGRIARMRPASTGE